MLWEHSVATGSSLPFWGSCSLCRVQRIEETRQQLSGVETRVREAEQKKAREARARLEAVEDKQRKVRPEPKSTQGCYLLKGSHHLNAHPVQTTRCGPS